MPVSARSAQDGTPDLRAAGKTITVSRAAARRQEIGELWRKSRVRFCLVKARKEKCLSKSSNPPPKAAAAGPEPPEPPEAETQQKPIATTIAFPPVVMRRIQERLRQDQQHNLRSLVLLGLSKIGVYVEPEYLKPVRRRWTR